MGKLNNLAGERFGRLLVLGRSENDWIDKNERRYPRWDCVCDCGNKITARADALRSGHTKSCGCYKRKKCAERVVAMNTTHGGADSRLYNTWSHMKARCLNKNNKSYSHYGGRGIKICDAWLNDFDEFRRWALLHGYNDQLTIDRIDVNGNYEPENCRWADHKTQANNTTKNHYIEYGGERHTLSQWSEITGVPPYAIRKRIKNGWSLKDALETPVKH